ncbi:hypothetical protein ACH5RR_025868 [Cinchona calisaya]|uniref:RING-type domain-containing protein n=1 Tax=Cinchona calisaya TaxID=153742 RepID=A0ABD2Z199_9GENT
MVTKASGVRMPPYRWDFPAIHVPQANEGKLVGVKNFEAIDFEPRLARFTNNGAASRQRKKIHLPDGRSPKHWSSSLCLTFHASSFFISSSSSQWTCKILEFINSCLIVTRMALEQACFSCWSISGRARRKHIGIDAFYYVVRLIARALSTALTVVFAIGGAFAGGIAGAFAGWVSNGGTVRGVAVVAIAGASISMEFLDALRTYWCSDFPDSYNSSSMADFLLKLVHGRFVNEQIELLPPATSRTYDLQVNHLNTSYRENTASPSQAASSGLSVDSLKNLPCHVLLDEMKAAEGASCTICLQDIVAGDTARSLPQCHHIFHLACVDRWLVMHGSCPSCAHLASKSDVAIHSSHEHKSTKRSSSQNHSSVPYETGKGDILDTSIKTLNDARETITKNSHKETEATPTQNSKGNLTEKEVNAPNEEQPSKAVVAVSANGGKTPLVIFSPQTLNATIGDLSCHNTCDKEESSESTSGRDRPWNRPKKGNKENNARDLDMSIIDSEALIQGVPSSTIPLEQLAQYFDDHEQRVDLVDDTLEEMEVSVTGPSKFDIFSNVVHTSLNANLTKNLDDGGNDVANSQAMIQMQNTIMTRRTPSIQTTLLKQSLKTFKPPTWPLPSTVSEFHSEEVISNCQREYVSMLWRNLKQQISKTSLEHMSSLNKHATRFLEEMGSKTDISALQGLIKTFFENIETYNSVKASFDGKMTQESYEGLLSTIQQNLRTIEIQEQEQVKSVEDLESQITQLENKEAELKEQLEHLCAQRVEKNMVLNQSRESLKKAQVEVAGLREEIQKIENTPRLSEEDVKVLGKMERLLEEDQNELSSFQFFG